jgi:tetratricopeptide (TPR) repeat protein
MARTGLRSRPDSPDEASLELLRRALQQPTTPVAMKADAWFLLGMAQHHRGETLAALTSLDQAIELDPYYFDARVTRLEALQTALVAGRRLGGTRDQCLARLADLLDDIKWIGVLAENRRQFLDLAGQLDTISGRGYAVKPFLIAIARLLGGDPGAAVDGFDRALAADKRLPQGCHGRLLHEIRQLRKTATERITQLNDKPKT